MQKKSFIKKLTGSREVSLLFVLILLFAVVSIVNPSFCSIKNILEMLKNNSITLILALGMLCVLLIGDIDISIAATLAFSGMASGLLIKFGVLADKDGVVTNVHILLAFLISIGIGLVCGILMGELVGRGKLPSIIATMGGMYIFRAAAYLIGNSQWAGAEALGRFGEFGNLNILGINVSIWITALCYIIFFLVLKWTKFGRNIYAVGSNAEAAQVSGINVARVKVYVFSIMGALAGLTGALATAVYAAAAPDMQTGKEMDVIAACVIGGVSMSGGRGSVGGTLLGALILAIITKALPLVGIDSIAQNTIKGVLIVVVVIVNVFTQRAMKKSELERRSK